MADFYDKYWARSAADWGQTAHNPGYTKATVIESIAGVVRKFIIVNKKNTALRYLDKKIQGRSVIDLGCAGGFFCYDILKTGASKIVGIDISPGAIAMARKKFEESEIPKEKYEFLVGNVKKPDFIIPDSDYVVALGLTPYLRRHEIDRLLSKIEGRYIFIDYWRKRHWWSVMFLCHFIYRKIKRFPFFSSFSRDELKAILEKHNFQNLIFFNSGENSFVFASPPPKN